VRRFHFLPCPILPPGIYNPACTILMAGLAYGFQHMCGKSALKTLFTPCLDIAFIGSRPLCTLIGASRNRSPFGQGKLPKETGNGEETN
jgi:hypothetical protein